MSSTYGYSVTFAGVGEDPNGNSVNLGYCSQIAVFVKSQEQNGRRLDICNSLLYTYLSEEQKGHKMRFGKRAMLVKIKCIFKPSITDANLNILLG